MKPHRTALVALALLALAGTAATGQPVDSMEMALFAPAKGLKTSSPPPLRLAERAGARPLAELAPAVEAAQSQVDELVLWNRLGRLPVKNGFSRPLPEARRVAFGSELVGRGGFSGEHHGGLLERTAAGALVWGTEVRVERAWRLRLHLAEVDLPAGTRMWVYGENGENVGPFGLELRAPQGDLWTPSIGGESIRLEVELPAGVGLEEGAAGFVVDTVLEILDGTSGALGGITIDPRLGECLVDAQCINTGTFSVINLAQAAIAALEFVDGGFSFVCSGGLLNSVVQNPYLLTANHCFNTQASASSLEATFDYFTNSCNGTAPSMGSLPRTNGSTLVATGASSDFTLVELSDFPDNNRVLLGWNGNASAAGNNKVLNRISHPVHPETSVWLPQRYSRNRVSTSTPACTGANRPQFLYEKFNTGLGDMGGTFGGSSGAPVILNDDPSTPTVNEAGQVVGQLTGGCGPPSTNQDGCNYVDNSEVDGAFSNSFNVLGPILNATGGCVPGPTTLCLNNNRFRVEVEWRNNQGVLRDANVVQGVQSNDSGLFYFLDDENWEFLIKVLNACNLPSNKYWVFAAATTNVEYTMTVTDTQAGLTRIYSKPAGPPAPAITDTQAFATCP